MKRSKSYKRRHRGALLAVDRSDPVSNLKVLVSTSRARIAGLGVNHEWERVVWALCPTLFALTGKHIESVTLNFSLPQSLGAQPLQGGWADVARALFIQREREQHKSVSSHRTFVATIGYIQAVARNRGVEQLTPAILDQACQSLDQDIASPQERYKRHNIVSEFARRCSELGLCYVDLKGYIYDGRSRPSNYGGRSGRRLDDPALLTEQSSRIVAEPTFKVLGELFKQVPRDHKYRVYLLIITLLVSLGRRLSEITLLPKQRLEKRASGYYFSYLKLKAAQGSRQYELTSMPVMTEVVPLVEAVLLELNDTSAELYACAEEMCRTKGPDLRFLEGTADDEPLYKTRLLEMGFPSSVLSPGGWFGTRGMIKWDLAIPGVVKKNGFLFRQDVERYCREHYKSRMTQPLYMAGGRNYFIKDMLLLKWLGTSSGHYIRQIADTVTAASFDKFLLHLEPLCIEYASNRIDQKFTSHDFRHTMNDALDKGGLPELMQTEYFGRKNPNDTKAYQHTSPEVKALKIREEIMLGRVGGALAERVMRLPQDKREAFLASKVRAVHDLGTGMCFHAWESGPCDRHLDCHSGCHLLGWPKQPAEPSQLYEELLRQAAQHLLQLEMGESIFPLAEGTDSSWSKHLCLKIYNILDRADELVPGTELNDLYVYINSGAFDKHVVPKLVEDVGKGYELYLKCRDRFNDACKAYAETTFFPVVPFVPVG